jgi:SOS regulatory protein LexA
MKALTKKQREVLDFINQYIEKYNISPTIEEIRKKLKVKAVSTIHEHLQLLKEKGYINKDQNQSRSIHTQKDLIFIKVPLLGKISAGQPIDVYEEVEEYVTVQEDNVAKKDNLFALKVVGNSMIDEGIFDGDTVVIKKQSSAENGQTVVAIIDDEKATLKKIYREKGGKFRLQPMNSAMLPLFRTEVEIRGVLLQVIRNIDNTPEVKQTKSKAKKLRTLDLFAGIGGIRLGFERAGFETVFANDFEANCKHTYDLNFQTSKLVVEDMRKIEIEDLPEFDFLLGGFPCQAFSIAGYRQGFNDEKNRGNLFFDVAKILKERKPMGFLLENVKNLASHDNGKTFKIIQQAFQYPK